MTLIVGVDTCNDRKWEPPVDYDLPISGEIPLAIVNNLKLLGRVFCNKLDEITMVNYESKYRE